VISQGKVEEIPRPKPEERRALIEDAAGLGKFGSAATARS
jgi:chromosome segregation ATPase